MRRCLLLLSLLAVGCSRPSDASDPQKDPSPQSQRSVVLVAGHAGDVPSQVRAELAKAQAARQRLLVYVGAPWCEPCQRFHDAAKSGALDQDFPGLRLLEFDVDRNGEELARAGYRSQMIPLFAVPNDDGLPSGLLIEGSIKGPGAVSQISPRLHALLKSSRQQ